VASRSESIANKKDGDDKMISTNDIIVTARRYNAQASEESHIHWVESLGEWNELKYLRPSVLDSLILSRALNTGPSYLQAVHEATGWSKDMYMGFQTAMLLGGPMESGSMSGQRVLYWKGILIGSIVYEKIKTRYV